MKYLLLTLVLLTTTSVAQETDLERFRRKQAEGRDMERDRLIMEIEQKRGDPRDHGLRLRELDTQDRSQGEAPK